MRGLFILSIVTYTLLGFSSRIIMSFIDMKSFDNANSEYLPQLIFVSVLIGILYFFWFKNVFPNGYWQQSSFGLMCILFAFSLVAFAVNRGWLFTLNTWFSKESLKTQMIIVKKEMSVDGKSKLFRLHTIERKSLDTFNFKVSRKKYNTIELNDTIEMYLEEGLFKIYYSRN